MLGRRGLGYLRDRSHCAARREKMVGQHWEEGNRVIVVVPSGDGSGSDAGQLMMAVKPQEPGAGNGKDHVSKAKSCK
ncbi:unnamed protein product [Camellia sinensis]